VRVSGLLQWHTPAETGETDEDDLEDDFEVMERQK
jgi:hypothetical protein